MTGAILVERLCSPHYGRKAVITDVTGSISVEEYDILCRNDKDMLVGD